VVYFMSSSSLQYIFHVRVPAPPETGWNRTRFHALPCPDVL